MTVEIEQMTCGACGKFDRNTIGGKPVSPDGAKGYCRAPKGLLLGQRNVTDVCPPNYQQHFISLAELAETATPTQ